MQEDDKIDSVVFEPDLRNCHICRTQEVCEVGGESKATGALKAMSGGLAAGAGAGTMVSPGWGTAIGGIVGAVGGGIMGAMSSGKEKFCQEIQSCEDVNM
jgi:outer membrane lipoprotein SlyB